MCGGCWNVSPTDVRTAHLTPNTRGSRWALRALAGLYWLWGALLLVVVGGLVWGSAFASPMTLLRVAETLSPFSPALGTLAALPLATLVLEDAL